jgi:hypothetical protein
VTAQLLRAARPSATAHTRTTAPLAVARSVPSGENATAATAAS